MTRIEKVAEDDAIVNAQALLFDLETTVTSSDRRMST